MNEAQVEAVNRRAEQRAQADTAWKKQHAATRKSTATVGALLAGVSDEGLRNSILAAMNAALSDATKDARMYTANVVSALSEHTNSEALKQVANYVEKLIANHREEVRKAWEQGKRDAEYQAAPIDVKELLGVMKAMVENQAHPEIKIDIPPANVNVTIDKGAITNVMPAQKPVILDTDGDEQWRVEAQPGIAVDVDEDAGIIRVRHE